MEEKGCNFISRKNSKDDFVLVRILGCSTYSIIHYVAIEEMLMQMELRYVRNAYEVELLKSTHKLSSEGLFVDLEAISDEEFQQFERIALRHVQGMLNEKQDR